MEEIPAFEARYGQRYHLPAAAVGEAHPMLAARFEQYYCANIQSVRTLGYRYTGNYFSWGGWGLSLG